MSMSKLFHDTNHYHFVPLSDLRRWQSCRLSLLILQYTDWSLPLSKLKHGYMRIAPILWLDMLVDTPIWEGNK